MRRRKLADDERAAVYVEFLVVFMPLFFLFLGMVQISMLYTAKLVVGHSAYRAARSAIVVLPDDPERYSGAPTDSVAYNETSSGIVPSTVRSFADFLGIDIPENLFTRGDARLNMVRLSAAVPLLGIAPSPSYLQSQLGLSTGGSGESAESVIQAIGFTGNGIDGIGGRVGLGAVYTLAAMGVTFPSSPGASAATSGTVTPATHTRGATSELTARVTYAYACGVPWAGAMICDGINGLSSQGDGQGRDELNAAVTPITRLAGRGLFYALRAEHTMLYQGADYY